MIHDDLGKCLTVEELRLSLKDLPGEWLVTPNTVGNLALYDGKTQSPLNRNNVLFTGFIDFLDGNVELVEDMKFTDYPEGAVNLVKQSKEKI